VQKGGQLMAEEVFIPKLGQTVEEVTIINWHVKDGDKVEHGQEVLEVETDKAVFDVEATGDGYIHIGPFKTGEVVPVLTVVAVIGEIDDKFASKQSIEKIDEIPASQKPSPISPNTSTRSHTVIDEKGKVFASPRAKKLAAERNVDLSGITPTGGGGIRVREQDVVAFMTSEVSASPIARRIAEDKGIDLRSIRGTGTDNKITRVDVENAIKLSGKKETGTQAHVPPSIDVEKSQPLKGVRKVIADRMAESSSTTAQVTIFMDVDASKFVLLREKLKKENESEWGFKPGYNDMLAKVCAHALRRFSYMNVRLNDNLIKHLAHVNIGIAVDAENGLYVPVIRDVDRKDLRTVGNEFRKLIEEVHNRKISPEDLADGTFTITNLGMYDVDGFTPVINLPEAAILGVGRISPMVVVVEDKIAMRNIMTLSLTFDHRLVDGAPAAKFLQYIKELIETPNNEILMV
jgi:pyruvate dehydrogenase E2 component (dihydrolipoamide acetyltransferase)